MSNKRHDGNFWPLVISLVNASESKYKDSDFKGSIDDKIKARGIIRDKLNFIGVEDEFIELIRTSRVGNPKYDLINDFKEKSIKKRG